MCFCVKLSTKIFNFLYKNYVLRIPLTSQKSVLRLGCKDYRVVIGHFSHIVLRQGVQRKLIVSFIVTKHRTPMIQI